MWSNDLERGWRELMEEVTGGVKEWRLQHPRATLAEIERAVDERLAKARARMVADAAQTSATADLTQLPEAERPRCAQCGVRLQVHGQETRHLCTTYDQDVVLRRSYAVCPACGQGVFPPG